MSTTTCKDPSVTWYNNQDGLNPCQQYQALRQLCDVGYRLGTLTPNTPPDNCESQNPACCCNSVAFSLSMLCLQCQQGVGTGRSGDTGIDAGVGAYQMYLADCGAGTNQSLPAIVQTAVCNSGLKLQKYQYGLFWGDGQWFLEFTRQTANLQVAAGEQDPGRCPAGSGPSSSTTASLSDSSTSSRPTSTSTQGSSPSSPIGQQPGAGDGGGVNTGAIIGASLGALAAVLILTAFIIYMIRRRKAQRDEMTSDDPALAPTPYFSGPAGTSFAHDPSSNMAVSSQVGMRPYTNYTSSDTRRSSSVGLDGATTGGSYTYTHTVGQYQADPFLLPGGPTSYGSSHGGHSASLSSPGAPPPSAYAAGVMNSASVQRSNTRGTMSSPPEYPFEELAAGRPGMPGLFGASSYAPSEPETERTGDWNGGAGTTARRREKN